MAKRKKRTSIRTAAGTAQQAFLERVRALRHDPLRVLPETPFGEPKAVARLRKGVEKVAAGKGGFLERRDRGIVGAVFQSVALAELDAVPRLLDAKVAGRRRFFLVRGQVERACMLGVQNHDEPVVLIEAYRTWAKKTGMHVFAGSTLTCTGNRPAPPDDWWSHLGRRAGITWQEHTCRTCEHPKRDLVELAFPDGPGVAVCEGCGARIGKLHDLVREQYAGPDQRRPVHVHVLRGGVDGERVEVERELVAKYRAGVASEKQVVDETLATWRGAKAGDVHFVLGGREFPDQDAFLDAVGPDDWLREALAAMTRGGHRGASSRLADVVAAHHDILPEGVGVFLDDATAFIRRTKGDALQVLQAAYEERQRRQRVSDVPHVTTGRLGTWLDGWARAVRGEGRTAGVARIRKALSSDIPNGHLYACLTALGGDLSLEARFGLDDKRQGKELADRLAPLLEATGKDYVRALDDYLQKSGSGETAR